MSGMRAVTIRQLHIFLSAARHLSFSRASRELHLSQPAVSMQIRQLEGSAGLPLFERSGKRLHLTQAGEEMQRHGQQIVAALAAAEDGFAALRGLRGGRLNIGVVSTAKYFAPKLLATFSQRHPLVEVKLAVNNRESILKQLANNEIDLAIMGTPPQSLDATAVAFAPHPLVVIAAPDHRHASRRRLALRDLEQERFVVREIGSGTRSAMERTFAAHRVKPQIGMEMSSNETIKQAVMAGMGLAFISQHTIALELASGVLKVLRVEGLPVMRQWCVVHRREKVLPPAGEVFKAFILDEGRALMKRIV